VPSASRVLPAPRITKHRCVVAAASVASASFGRMRTKLAQNPGVVAGPTIPSAALESSGRIRVGPCSCSSAPQVAAGMPPSVPSVIGLEA
jgi:hypothetical protein